MSACSAAVAPEVARRHPSQDFVGRRREPTVDVDADTQRVRCPPHHGRIRRGDHLWL